MTFVWLLNSVVSNIDRDVCCQRPWLDVGNRSRLQTERGKNVRGKKCPIGKYDYHVYFSHEFDISLPTNYKPANWNTIFYGWITVVIGLPVYTFSIYVLYVHSCSIEVFESLGSLNSNSSLSLDLIPRQIFQKIINLLFLRLYFEFITF